MAFEHLHKLAFGIEGRLGASRPKEMCFREEWGVPRPCNWRMLIKFEWQPGDQYVGGWGKKRRAKDWGEAQKVCMM